MLSKVGPDSSRGERKFKSVKLKPNRSEIRGRQIFP